MTLVLLHALPLDGSMWDPVRAELAATSGPGGSTTEVVAPTLYGLGRSIEAWAAGVLDRAGPGPLVVAGCSVGGSCAIEVARLAPDRVAALVLLGAKAGHRPEPDLRDAAVDVLTERGMAGAWPTYWEPLFAPGADPAAVEHGRRIAFALPVDDVIDGVRVFHGRPDRSDVLAALDLPVVVARGEHDRIPRHPEALVAGLRRGSFRPIAGAGHYLPLERPAEVAAILRHAIAGADPTAGSDPARD